VTVKELASYLYSQSKFEPENSLKSTKYWGQEVYITTSIQN